MKRDVTLVHNYSPQKGNSFVTITSGSLFLLLGIRFAHSTKDIVLTSVLHVQNLDCN